METVLENFIRDLIPGLGIPMRVITLPCDEWSCLDMGLRKNLFGSVDYSKIGQRLAVYEDAVIYHYVDLFQCHYTSCRLPDRGEYLILGPLLFEKVTGKSFDVLFRSLKLPETMRESLQNYYCSVRVLQDQTMYESLISLIFDQVFGKGGYKIIHERAFPLDDTLQLYNNHFRVPEQPFLGIQQIEVRYALENLMLAAVTSGNECQAVDYVTKLTALIIPPRLTNELRDRKDLCITINTLLRKAAEHASVHPIHIDSFSNHNVQLIEQLTSPEECRTFVRKLVQGYCGLIQKYNLKAHSNPIRKVITYISTDLTADLSLKSLAAQINVNASYLSSLFKKEMGIPLTEYVNRSRIQHAQILLLTSDLPLKAIALRCGITDMQYFSRMFKRITGVTPKVYQDTATFYTYQDLKLMNSLRSEHRNETGMPDHDKSTQE